MVPNLDKVVEKVIVKMADYAVGGEDKVIATLGLGSCVAVSLYDSHSRIGGLVHIMLPENPGDKNTAKYADTAIPLLINQLEKMGAYRRRLSAKIVGGASMFKSESGESIMKIGKRNIEAVRKYLKKAGVKITAEDVGKDYGRSMYFYLEDGRVEIRSFNKDNLLL
ncbi:MAG: chemotaxis protein CheD [Halanaerobium sp.]